MPRLLILCEYPTVLGGEQSMLATLPAVQAAGFEVIIAAPASGRLANTTRGAGVEHLAWPAHDVTGVRLPLSQLRVSLKDIIDRLQPDLVHANSLSTSRIAGPVGGECAMRSLGYLRDIISLNTKAINDINQHDCIVAVSAATRDFHIEQGLDAEKCRVLHNGVDLDRFRPRPATGFLPSELRLPAETRFIATVGQLGLRKGVDVALEAASLIASEFGDVHWLIVGERTSQKAESLEYERMLHDRAQSPPLRGRVHFLGQRDDIASLLAECAALVHAARQEPLGRILLESAASGLAVIATDVGGTREIFPPDDHAAILVAPDDADAIAAATKSIFSDEPLRKRLAANARRRAEAAFDIRTAAERLIAIYQELLA